MYSLRGKRISHRNPATKTQPRIEDKTPRRACLRRSRVHREPRHGGHTVSSSNGIKINRNKSFGWRGFDKVGMMQISGRRRKSRTKPTFQVIQRQTSPSLPGAVCQAGTFSMQVASAAGEGLESTHGGPGRACAAEQLRKCAPVLLYSERCPRRLL